MSIALSSSFDLLIIIALELLLLLFLISSNEISALYDVFIILLSYVLCNLLGDITELLFGNNCGTISNSISEGLFKLLLLFLIVFFCCFLNFEIRFLSALNSPFVFFIFLTI